MAEVKLHIYDVTNSENGEAANFAIVQLNNVMKEAIAIGGVFHTAVQVYGDEEWGFMGGFEDGTGVYSCPAGKYPLFTYRESTVVGRTNCSPAKVNEILKQLSTEWPQKKYDTLKRNCNHFCNEFLERLGVPSLPGWVNRLANAGGAASDAVDKLKEAKSDMVHRGKEVIRDVRRNAVNAPVSLLGLNGVPTAASAARLLNKKADPFKKFLMPPTRRTISDN